MSGYLRVLHREFKDDFLVGQLVINTGESVQLGLNVHLLLRIQEHLQQTTSVWFEADALADYFSGVDKVVQHCFVDGSQGSRAWARSLAVGLAVDVHWQNRTLSNNDNVTTTTQASLHMSAQVI